MRYPVDSDEPKSRSVRVRRPARVGAGADTPGAGIRGRGMGPLRGRHYRCGGRGDGAEKEPRAAFLVNALAVRNLALACRKVDARLIHFPTDYVFDGFARHPYAEDDATHPLGAYAVSKLAGELYAQAYLDRVLVVRTSGVFGPGGLN